VRQIRDAVHIDASPEELWSCLAKLADPYTDWHPDQVSAKWVEGEPNGVGSILEAVECIGSHRETLRFVMADIDAAHLSSGRI